MIVDSTPIRAGAAVKDQIDAPAEIGQDMGGATSG